jgi:hypothetical protein
VVSQDGVREESKPLGLNEKGREMKPRPTGRNLDLGPLETIAEIEDGIRKIARILNQNGDHAVYLSCFRALNATNGLLEAIRRSVENSADIASGFVAHSSLEGRLDQT